MYFVSRVMQKLPGISLRCLYLCQQHGLYFFVEYSRWNIWKLKNFDIIILVDISRSTIKTKIVKISRKWLILEEAPRGPHSFTICFLRNEILSQLKMFFSAQCFRITFLECSDCLKYWSKQSSELSMIQVIKADLHWPAFVTGCWSSKPSFLLGYNVWEVLRLTNTEWRFTNVVSPLLDPFS